MFFIKRLTMGETYEPRVERAVHNKQEIDKETRMNRKNVYIVYVACENW